MTKRRVTRWKYRLYCGLALLWALFLPQALLTPDTETEVTFRLISWGTAVWALILVGLIALANDAWRRRHEP